ncbi:MAG: hypothetical protein P8Y24_10905 [Gammaproteobacteria bacterium]|jgi:hypothetical protein
MKYWFTLFLLLSSFSVVSADDRFTENIYTSVTLLYWCTYKKVPVNKEDIAKVAEIDFSNPKITIDLDEWLSLLSYEINGDVLTIINESKIIFDGKNQSSIVSKSSTKCDPRKMPNKKVE